MSGGIGHSHSTHGGSSACRRIQSGHEVSKIMIDESRDSEATAKVFSFSVEQREILMIQNKRREGKRKKKR